MCASASRRLGGGTRASSRERASSRSRPSAVRVSVSFDRTIAGRADGVFERDVADGDDFEAVGDDVEDPGARVVPVDTFCGDAFGVEAADGDGEAHAHMVLVAEVLKQQ